MPEGWVYVMTNEHMPGIVKIGQTANDPLIRASDLRTTGVPSDFVVEYQALFEGYARIERTVHRALADHRVSSNREFFRIDVARAILAIREASIHPPKREVSKQDRLRQAEQAKRQAEKEEKQRQDKKKHEAEVFDSARQKIAAFNDEQDKKIHQYIADRIDMNLEWPIILFASVITVPMAMALVHPIIGIFIAFIAYAIGKSIENSKSDPLRIEAKNLYPKIALEQFLRTENFAANIYEDNKGGYHVKKSNDNTNDIDSKKSYPSFECKKCRSTIYVENAIGFFQVECNKCGLAYKYDRPSFNVHPEIYETY